MSNSSSIFIKKVNSRLKWFTFFSIPILTLGSVALILQLFFFKGSTNYFRFDFNSGILWKWQEDEHEIEGKPEVISQFFPQNLIPENFSALNKTKEENLGTIVLSDMINAKTISQLPEHTNTALKPIEVISSSSIKPNELYSFVLPGEAIKRLESPTIFNPNAECRSSKFSIGVSLAPSFGYRTYRYDVNQPITSKTVGTNFGVGQSEKYRNKTDKMVVTFFGGVDIYYELTPRITLQSGLNYGTYGEQIQVSELQIGDPNITMAQNRKDEDFNSNPVYCPSENINTDEPTVPFFNQYRMLEIPLIVNYKLFRKKMIYEAQIGTSIAMLDHADALVYDFKSSYYYWVSTSDFAMFNKYFATGIVGISLSQMVNNRAEIFLNPQFRYLFTPTFNNKYPVAQHQHSTGLRMGIKLHL